jgi:hypothetical protein
MALRDDVAARLKKLLAVTDDLEVVAEATIPLVREAERERCARVAEEYPTNDHSIGVAMHSVATAIRNLKDE